MFICMMLFVNSSYGRDLFIKYILSTPEMAIYLAGFYIKNTYGEKVSETEKPHSVTDKGDFWVVNGNLSLLKSLLVGYLQLRFRRITVQCNISVTVISHLLMLLAKTYYEHTLPEVIAFRGEMEALPGGVAVLATLMDQYGLKQSDFADEIGGKSLVSRILRGERKLTVEHIGKLAARFGISPALFI